MAVFCYISEDGTAAGERFVRPGKTPPRFIVIGGKRCYRDLQAEQSGMRGGLGCWPMCSNAIRYLPSRKQEYEQLMASHGVTATLNERGQAVIESNQHRNEIMKVLGVHDKDAGYSQYAGRY